MNIENSKRRVNRHDIDFNSLLSKGHVVTETKDEMLHITTTQRLSTRFDKEDIPVNSYVYLPDTYKLPRNQ